ncbi:YDG domain-containing protein [Limnohabitans sp. DCL3]|uniref:YDG domain-containing protein n=1 Tax=Limnohabitans sp. DCL3 TaxID=3374103 RepID=UPI003A8364D8
MNHVYRLKRSGRTQQLQAVPETARSAGKGAASTGKVLGTAVGGTLASFALSGIVTLLYAQQAPPPAHQLPQGGVVTRGSAHIVTGTGSGASTALMSVNQSSPRAVIDWASFNVGSQAKVQFNQPSSSAVTLNNILGHNASQIYGQIGANGQVFLSNPNGVYFSPTAQVNVGGLVATTGKANADEFMAGQASFNRGGSTGSVVNDGQLSAAAGGYIALLAPEVRNQGLVIAQAGTVALASGEAITLNFNNTGTGLVGITTTPQAIAALVENRSAVLAEGGQIILSAHALASLQGSVVKNSGQLSATSLTEKGGKIVLMGDSIALTGTSQIQASGATGGGTVLVGGDWQGTGDTRQATKVTMAQGASIEANATGQGDGGKVVLWSDVYKADGLTQVEGHIEAKGSGSGNGGQVETSGHTLQVGEQAAVQTQGSGSGQAGQWLLDPANITISSSASSGYTDISGTYTPNSGAATSIVNVTTLQTALNNGDVTITTTNTGTAGASMGDITVSSAVSWTSANKLTLIANRGVTGSSAITTGAVGSNLTIDQAGNSTYSGTIGGSGSLTKLGAGTLTLTGNTYSGGTTLSAGSVVYAPGSLGSGPVVNNANITVDAAAVYTLANDLSGTGTMTLTGNALKLTGNNSSYSGAITVTNGVLQIGNYGTTGTLGTGSVSLGVGTSLILARSDALTVAASISGAGSVKQQGTGTITLTNFNNSYTGGTVLSAGTLNLGDLYVLGPSGSITFSGGILQFSANNNTDYSSRFSNASSQAYKLDTNGVNVALQSVLSSSSGTLTKYGSGILSLTAANTYTGATTVSEGTLSVQNAAALGSTSLGTTVAAGATLELSAVAVGAEPVTLNGGTLKAAGAISSLSGAVTLGAAGSTIQVASGVPLTLSGVISGAGMDLTITGGGLLYLTGNNSYSGATTISAGTVQINTGGRMASTVVNNSSSLIYNTGSSTTYSGAISGTGDLTVSGATTLTLTGTNTYTGATTIGVSSTLVLGNSGSSGELAADSAISNSGILKLDRTDAFTLGNTISGGGVLQKYGAGTATLTGNNSYTGGTTLAAGTLSLGSANAIGDTSTLSNVPPITFSGGTLQFSVSNTTDYSSRFATGVAQSYSLDTNGQSVTLASALTGTGTSTLTKLGVGTLTLSGTNTYTGATTVSSGTLAVTSAAGLGTTAGNTTVASGAVLDLQNVTGVAETLTLNGGSLISSTGTSALSGAVTLGSASTVDVGGTQLTLSGVISGPSKALTKTGSGTLILSGGNTYSGGTTISAGTVQVGSGASAGSLGSGAVANNSSLVFNSSSAIAVAGAISGTGTLTQSGTGTTSLAGTNTYSGATTISAGTLQIGNAGTTGTLSAASTITNNGTLSFNRTDAVTLALDLDFTGVVKQAGTGALTLSGVLSGTGSVTAAGTGVLTLTGNNSYTGGSTVNSNATLSMGNGGTVGTLGPGAVTNNGTLKFYRSDDITWSQAISGTGVVGQHGTGTLTLTGNNSYSGGVNINSGILNLGSASAIGSSGTISFTGGVLQFSADNNADYSARFSTANPTSYKIDTNGQNITLATGFGIGQIASNTSTLYKYGSGTLTLSGNNTYGGGSFVNAGTLAVTSTGKLGNSSNTTTVEAGAVLDLQNADITNFVLLNGGTLSASTGSSNIGLNYGLTLGASGSTVSVTGTALSIGGVISGTGMALTKTGSGTLVLTGSNTYDGGTTISAGTLQVGAGGSSGSLVAGAVINNGTLKFNRVGTLSVANDISGTGSLVNAGFGTITLTGNNSYSGGTTLAAGTLNLGSANAIGDASSLANVGPITFSGGVLQFSVSNSTDYSSRFATGLQQLYSLDTNGQSVTLASALTGTGTSTLTKTGSGTLTLSGANTHTGATTVSAGTLAVTHAAALGTTAAGTAVSAGAVLDVQNVALGDEVLTLNGSTLQTSSGTSSLSGAITLGSSSTVDVGGTQLTLSGVISGASRALTKTGSGMLILSGGNTYSGSTTISAGILQVGDGGTTGSLTGGVVNNATLALKRSDSPTWSNTITGTGTTSVLAGSWSMGGSSRLSATGVLNVAGGATLNLATFSNSVAGLTGSGTVTGSTGTLNFSSTGSTRSVFSGTFTNTGAIGAMKLVQQGTGTQVVQGTSSTFTGATSLTSGTLEIGSDSALGSSTITFATAAAGTSTLALNGVSIANPIATVGAVTATNFVTSLSSTTPSTISAAVNGSLDGGITFSTAVNASLYLTNTLTTGSLTQKFTPASGGEVRLSGAVSGTGGLQQAGTGRLTLAGNNTGVSYTLSYASGNTGTIRLANNTALGTGNASFTVPEGATLELGALDGSDLNITSKSLALASSGTAAGGGFLHNVAGHNTWSGAITLNNNSVITVDTGTSLNLSSTSSTVAASSRAYFNLTEGSLNFGTLTGTAGSSAYLKIGSGSLTGPITNVSETTGVYARLYDATGLYTSVYGDAPVYSLGFFTSSTGDSPVSLTGSDYSGSASWTGLPTSSSNAATYSVTYTSGITVSNTAYMLIGAGTARNWTVSPKLLTFSASKDYDGSTALGAVTVNGRVGTQTLTVTGAQANASHVSANSSNYITGLTLGDGSNGGLASNYALPVFSRATAPVTINAVTLTPTLTNTGITREYDGSNTAPVFTPTATFTGLLAGDSAATVTLSQTGATYNSKDVATASSIAVTGLGISGISSPIGSEPTDYQLASSTATIASGVSITPRTVSLSATKTYDGTTALTNAQVTVTTGVANESLTVSAATGSDAHVNTSGKYITAATLADGTGGLANNYQLPSMDASHAPLTVQARDITVTLTNIGVTKTYDGSTSAPTGFVPTFSTSGAAGSDVVNVTASGASSYNDKNVLLATTLTTSGLSVSSVSTTGVSLGSQVGDYQLTSTSASTSASITTAPLSISGITASNKTYDRSTTATVSTASVVKTGLIGSDQVTVSATGSFATVSAGDGKTVNLSSTYGGTDAANYSITDQLAAFANIGKANLSVTGVMAQNKTYDRGTTATLSGTAAVAPITGDTVTVNTSAATGQFADKNVGTNKAVTVTGFVLDGTDADNYQVVQPSGLTANIGKANLSVTGVMAQNKTYDRDTTATLMGTAAVAPITGDTVTVNTSAATGQFADKNVGTNKAVTVTGFVLDGTDADNYQVVQPSGLTANIGKANLSVTGVMAQNKTYDRDTTATLMGTAAVAPITGDTVTVNTSAATGQFADKNVGTNKAVTVTGFVLDGTDADNYQVVQPSGLTANIGKANLSVTGVMAQNKTYDRDTTATLMGTAAVAPITGDTVTVNTSAATGQFADKNVGTNKAVTVTGFVLDGTDADNYQVVQPSGLTANIGKANLSVTGVMAQNKTYDRDTTATLMGTAAVAPITGDTVTVNTSAATGQFADKNVGTNKAVTVTGFVLDGTDADNYQVVQPSGLTANIGKANLSVTGVMAQNKTYDRDTTATLMGTAAVAPITGDTVTVNTSAATGQFADKNVGTNKAVTVTGFVLDGTDADNYQVVQPSGLTANIGKANLSVTGVMAQNKTYDATTATTLSGTALVSPLAGDLVSVDLSAAVGQFADKNVGTNKAVTASGVALSGRDADNYQVVQPTGLSANITRATLMVNVSTVDKVYDGSPVATLSFTDNRQGSDVLLLTATGAFADKNVGTGKTVSVSGLNLTGTDANNYSLSAGGWNTTTTGNITRLHSVTWAGGATGDWLNPANWAGGAVPDLSNVANVVIPSGKAVNFAGTALSPAQSGTVNIDSLTGAGSVSVTSGTLGVGTGGVNLSQLTQTGGTLAFSGNSSLISTSAVTLKTLTATGSLDVTSTGDITMGDNITMGNGPLVIKTPGSIVQNASTTVSSSGGNITYWADSDANGVGSITLSAGTSTSANAKINASTGDIVLGGGNGVSADSGPAVGARGVLLGTYANLSGRNITVVGKGDTSAGAKGVFVGNAVNVSATGAVAITGTGGGSSGTSHNYGVEIGSGTVDNLAPASVIEATGSGSVTVTGTGGGLGTGSNNYGVTIFGGRSNQYTTLRTASGALKLVATSGVGSPSASPSFLPYYYVRLGGTDQTGPVTVQGGNLLFGTTLGSNNIQTTGAVTLEPLVGSTSFTRGMLVPPIAASASSVTLGRLGNTTSIDLVSDLSVQGPLTVYGQTSMNANMMATGVVSFYGPVGTLGNVLLTAPAVQVVGSGATSVTVATNTTTFAGTGLGQVTVLNQGPLTLGTVGVTTGVSSSNYMDIATLTGDLTVAANVSTTTSSNMPWLGAAVALTAGKNKSALDATGGNVIITGGSTVSVGTYGRAIFYTGSVGGSTGVTALVGSGNGHYRYGSDESTKNYTASLGQGLYAVYRDQPVVSWSAQADQSIVYGQTPVYNTSGDLSTYSTTGSYALGLQNGDQTVVSQALVLRNAATKLAAGPNSTSGLYDVAVYEASKTAGAEALGYAGVNPRITVTRAPLTITAKDYTKVYDGGTFVGGNGLTYTGLLGNDTSAAVTTLNPAQSIWGGSAQYKANAGSYSIAVSNLKAANYDITYVPGTLSISRRPLTIRVTDDARFVSQADAVGYAGYSYSGLATGQSMSSLGTVSIARAGGASAPGTYNGVLQASIPGLTNTNYQITYVPGNYTIVPADQLLVKLANTTATYGSDPVYSILSAQYLKSSTNTVIDLTSRAAIVGTQFGLTDGDGGSTSFSVGALSTSLSSAGKINVFGGYQLGASSINNTSINYKNNITVTGALTVTPQSLAVVPSGSLSKTYDGTLSMPGLVLSLSGAQSADKVAVSGHAAYEGPNAGTTAYSVNNLLLGGVDSGNYVLGAGNSISGSNAAITPAALTVTAQSDRLYYNGMAYQGGNGVIYSGFVNNEDPSVLGGSVSYGGSSQGAINAGAYTITPWGLSSNNYTITYENAPLSIDPVTLTASAVNLSLKGPVVKVYDGSDVATLTSDNYVFSGWIGSDGASVTKTTGTYDSPHAGPAKLVTVNLTSADYLAEGSTVLSNYILPTTVSGVVGAVMPKPVTLSGLQAANKTYDGNTSVVVTQWGSVDTGVAHESLTLLPGTASFDDATAQTGKTVTASAYSLADGNGGLASNYVLTSTQSTTTADIDPKAVVVSSLARVSTYDGVSTHTALANATGFSTTAMATGEWVSAVSTTASGAGVVPGAVAQVGSYTVTPGSPVMGEGSASNYSFSFVDATSTVSKANLVLTGQRSYDGSQRVAGATLTATGVNGEIFAVTGSGGSDNLVTANVQTAMPLLNTTGLVLGAPVHAGALSNYNGLSTTGSAYTVTPANLSVTTHAVVKTYDGTNAANGMAVVSSGTLFANDTITGGAFAFDNKNAGTNKSVGVGGVTVNDGNNGANYTVSYVNNTTSTIHPAALTVMATAVSKTYDGTTSASGSGTVGALAGAGDVLASAGGQVYADKNAGTGNKTVMASGVTIKDASNADTTGNYDIQYVDNTTSTISQAALTVTATAVSKTYDGTTTATGTGTVGPLAGAGDVVNGTGYQAFTNKNAGTGNKTVTAFGVSIKDSVDADMTGNYAISYVDHTTSTINKAHATVTANGATLTYNGANQTASGFTASGLVGGESASVLSGVSASRTEKNAGTYTTTASGTDSNYHLTFVDGAMVIGKANATVTANGATLTYNGANQTASGFTASGLVGGETASVLSGVSASRTEKNAGTYTTTASGTDSNYNLTFVDGAMVIGKANATVTANGATLTYNGANQTASGFTASGLVGGESASVLSGVSASRTEKNAGTYTTTASGTDSNYNLTFVDGAMVIQKATVTPIITASNKVYDTTPTAQGAVSLAGVFSVDAAAASAVATGYHFADANVGTAKTVTAQGITLGSGLSSNYALSSTIATGQADITPAPLTVTAINDAKFVTQLDSANFKGYAVTGLLGSDSPDSAGVTAGVRLVRSNAGVETAAVYPGVLVPSGNAAIGNYTVSYVPGTFTIVPAGQLLVSTTSTNTTYGTAGHNPIASVSYLDENSSTINNLSLSGQAVVGGATVYTYADGANGTVSFAVTPTGTSTSAGGRLNQGSYGLAVEQFSKTTNNLSANTATVTGNLTVQPLAITVAAVPTTTTYNASTQTQGITSGVLSGDDVTVSGAVSQRNAGTYGSALVVSGADVGNYKLSIEDHHFEIAKANATVTANGATLTYNGANQTASGFTASGLVGGETASVLSGVSASRTEKNAGTYTTTASGTDSNYNLTFVDGAMVIGKANATVTANGATLTYNGANQTASGFTASGLVGGETASVLSGVSASRTEKNAGTYTTTASGTDSNYNLTFVDGAMVIGKANATVTANGATLTYNGANQTASGFTASGLVGGETASVLSGVSASRTEKNAGTYTTTASGTDSNYNLTFVDGAMVIQKATVTPIITASNKVYDTTPTAQGAVSLAGVFSVDAAAASAVATGYHFADANVGTAKTVTAQGITLGSGLSSNYALSSTIATGQADITPAPLTVTAINDAKFVTQLDSANFKGYAVTGLLGSDSPDSAGVTAGVRLVRSNAGVETAAVYPGVLVPSGNAAIGNYTVSYVPGTFTIVPAGQLLVSTTSTNTTYGTAGHNPIASVSYLDENSSTINNLSLSGQAVVGGATVYTYADGANGTVSFAVTPTGTSTSAGGRLNQGSYGLAVEQFSKTTNNLSANTATVTGNLTVQPLAITVAAVPTTTTYNASTQTQGITSGVLSGDDVTVSGAVSQRNAGTYGSALVVSGADVGNYKLSIEDHHFEIAKANATVTANGATLTYNGANQTASGFTASGLVGGETASVLSGVSASRTEKNAGTYTTTASGTDSNYHLTFVDGAMVIGKANATVTANGATLTYNGANQTASGFTASGLVGGETASVLSGVSASRTEKNAGTYTTTASGTDSNYNLTFVDGAMVIGKANATVTANGATLTYNGANQTASGFTASGLVGGESASVLSGVSASRTEKNAGTYTTTASGTDSNYNLTFVDGAMVIGKAPLTVAFVAADKVYDGNTEAWVTSTDNRFNGDALRVVSSAHFPDKNVGMGKTVSVTGVSLSGTDAGNYTVNASDSASANITRLPQVNWVGGSTGSWFDPANWAGGAVPDLANVAHVTIPVGVTVNFDNAAVSPAQAGPVSVDHLGTSGSLTLSAGALNVGSGGVTLNTLTQTGGTLASIGAVALGSLNQLAGTLSAGSLSTRTAFSQTGSGRMTVVGDVTMAATADPVVLGHLSVGGVLNVNSTNGGITQTDGTVLSVSGPAFLSASQDGAAAHVNLSNTGNTFSGPVTVTGADVSLRAAGPLSVSVTAMGNATLSSGGPMSLGTSQVDGDWQVTTADADVTQTGPVVVEGATRLDAGTGHVLLNDVGNRFAGPVTLIAGSSSMSGVPSTLGSGDRVPSDLRLQIANTPQPYQVTLIQLPQGELPGAVHVVLNHAAGDVKIELPEVLLDWMAKAGALLTFESSIPGGLDGIRWSGQDATLTLKSSMARRYPLEWIMRAGREHVKVRMVWKS